MDRKQHIAIYTTASLPWMTGTAVNPLFRAAYLAKSGERKVTLVIPWLSLNDQELVYPNKITFNSPSAHESYVRRWLEERTGFLAGINIRFYPSKFDKEKRSILAVGDITEIIPDKDADIAVLEEPEHLTWYHHGKRWKAKFRLVIGVVHTNYLEYVRREKNALHAFFLKHINSWVVHIYCEKVIRLSAATQDLPRSVVCNVHGVNPRFLDIGRNKHEQKNTGNVAASKVAYYIGKMVWSKGYRELLQLLQKHQNQLSHLQVDLYGNGEDSDEVREAARKLKIIINVYPGRDHADHIFHQYRMFLNPSTTDVVCTTTAEALAMGKFVVCADHPSNDFFKQFPNCRLYKDSNEFIKTTLMALDNEPAPLTDEQRHELSWEAATERFMLAADLTQKHFERKQLSPSNESFMSLSLGKSKLTMSMENASAFLHHTFSGIEAARCTFGAIPGSLQPDAEQCEELGLAFPNSKEHDFCKN